MKEGLIQYQAALSFIENDKDKARVMFNLGLAHVKGKDAVNAYRWFKQSKDVGGEEFNKSGDYVKKLESHPVIIEKFNLGKDKEVQVQQSVPAEAKVAESVPEAANEAAEEKLLNVLESTDLSPIDQANQFAMNQDEKEASDDELSMLLDDIEEESLTDG